jgi:hypothetical protein
MPQHTVLLISLMLMNHSLPGALLLTVFAKHVAGVAADVVVVVNWPAAAQACCCCEAEPLLLMLLAGAVTNHSSSLESKECTKCM